MRRARDRRRSGPARRLAALAVIGAAVWLAAGDRAPAAPADDMAARIAGTWERTTSRTTLELTRTGPGRLKGRFVNASGTKSWPVKGQVTDTGGVFLIRYIPVSELGKSPAAARRALLAGPHGAPDRPGFMRGPVQLKFDPAKQRLKGRAGRIEASWYSASGKLKSARVVWFGLDMVRPATKGPDLITKDVK